MYFFAMPQTNIRPARQVFRFAAKQDPVDDYCNSATVELNSKDESSATAGRSKTQSTAFVMANRNL